MRAFGPKGTVKSHYAHRREPEDGGGSMDRPGLKGFGVVFEAGLEANVAKICDVCHTRQTRLGGLSSTPTEDDGRHCRLSIGHRVLDSGRISAKLLRMMLVTPRITATLFGNFGIVSKSLL
ncbi:hypothetical protein U1Q18_005557 [Sarracenia purpurea var. burkii]